MALQQDCGLQSYLHRTEAVKSRLLDYYIGRLSVVVEPFRPSPGPGKIYRGRQRRLARWLAEARRRLLLRRLLCCLGRLEEARISSARVVKLETEVLELWFYWLEDYDSSADPIRADIHRWQLLMEQQRVLLLRVVIRELRQLGQLLPPLRRSLAAPGGHSEGFHLLVDTLESLDPEQLRLLAEAEALWLVEQLELEKPTRLGAGPWPRYPTSSEGVGVGKSLYPPPPIRRGNAAGLGGAGGIARPRKPQHSLPPPFTGRGCFLGMQENARSRALPPDFTFGVPAPRKVGEGAGWAKG